MAISGKLPVSSEKKYFHKEFGADIVDKLERILGTIFVVDIFLYWSALSLTYNGYKAFHRGFDYIAGNLGLKIASLLSLIIVDDPLSKGLTVAEKSLMSLR